MPSKVQMIACHYANKSGRGQAACFLSIETVRDMVEAGEAVWNKRATFVNFTKTEAEMYCAARSLKMSWRVTEGNAMGDRRDMAIVEGWRPYMVPSVYQEAA